ncbi:MAG: NADAR family protein [Verrucomicrobia bacterium]|nr:NADAR family protein [Verrucomicrobiota bacterium]
MKKRTLLLALLLAAATFAADSTPARKPDWDETFEGVVHNEKKVGGFVGDYRWLSNFYKCRVEWEGRAYTSSEAAYQSGKYPAAERDIFTTLDPDPAKKLSRTKPYDTAAWEARKERTMQAVLWAKFSQNPELAAKLLATGGRVLEETNWWGDRIWGVYQGEGQNLLGRQLMEIRARLTQEAPAAAKSKP